MIHIIRVSYKNEYDFEIGTRGYKQALEFNDLACKFHIQQHKQDKGEICLLIEQMTMFYRKCLPMFQADVYFMITILCGLIEMENPL